MKKCQLSLVIFFIFLACPRLFAAEIKGVITSFNPSTNAVVIKQADGSSVTTVVHPKITKQLRLGSTIKAVTDGGSNVAQTVELEVN